MSTTPTPQQGGSSTPATQAGQSSAPTPAQGQTSQQQGGHYTIRDWASI